MTDYLWNLWLDEDEEEDEKDDESPTVASDNIDLGNLGSLGC